MLIAVMVLEEFDPRHGYQVCVRTPPLDQGADPIGEMVLPVSGSVGFDVGLREIGNGDVDLTRPPFPSGGFVIVSVEIEPCPPTVVGRKVCDAPVLNNLRAAGSAWAIDSCLFALEPSPQYIDTPAVQSG